MNWIELGRNVEITTDTMFPLILRRNDGKLYIWRSKFWFTVWSYLLPVKLFYRRYVFTHMMTIKQPDEE